MIEALVVRGKCHLDTTSMEPYLAANEILTSDMDVFVSLSKHIPQVHLSADHLTWAKQVQRNKLKLFLDFLGVFAVTLKNDRGACHVPDTALHKYAATWLKDHENSDAMRFLTEHLSTVRLSQIVSLYEQLEIHLCPLFLELLPQPFTTFTLGQEEKTALEDHTDINGEDDRPHLRLRCASLLRALQRLISRRFLLRTSGTYNSEDRLVDYLEHGSFWDRDAALTLSGLKVNDPGFKLDQILPSCLQLGHVLSLHQHLFQYLASLVRISGGVEPDRMHTYLSIVSDSPVC